MTDLSAVTHIRLATVADAECIERLRISQFEASQDFQVNDKDFLKHLIWSASDDHSYVLGVWHHGQLVATMRAEIIPDRTGIVSRRVVYLSRKQVACEAR
jgi:hypothetical protein